MKRIIQELFKKIIACVMTVAVVASAMFMGNEMTVQASGQLKFIDAAVDNAPLRTGPSEEHAVVARVSSGRVMKVVDSCTNNRGNLWYEVAWENEAGDGNTAYIYSGNVSGHHHDYKQLKVEGVTYSYCGCGNVYVLESSYIKVSQANTLVLGAASVAGGTSIADGPLPLGDMIGAVLLAGTFCLAYSGVIPDTLQEITTKTKFSDYIRENGEVCDNTNFRMVVRTGEFLEVISDECLSIPQAFVYARLCGGDVWTPDETGFAAMSCAAMNGAFFGPEVDEMKPGYYYHYHMGPDHKHTVGGHVFYGKGQFTNCVPVGAY